MSECVHRALLEHDLAETPAEPLLEGLPRCRPSSRPKSRKSITTCSHTETKGETAAHSKAGRRVEVEMRNRGGVRGGREKNRRAANIKNSLEESHVVTSKMKMSENSCMI